MTSPEQISEKLSEAVGDCFPEQLPTPVLLKVSDGCDVLVTDNQFICILAELINNCAEKPVENIKVNVSISFNYRANTFQMTVEDTVSYQPKQVQKILRVLNSNGPIKTADKRPDLVKSLPYGSGIVMARNYFTNHKGTLLYRESDDHRIIAEAHWKK